MVTACVLITCHNRKEKTINCVTSIVEKNPRTRFSFIIVDDGCTDGTKEALLSIKDTDIRVLDGDGNLFYSGGMRMAIDYAKKQKDHPDFYILANDDVSFYENGIDRMIELAVNRIVAGVTDDGNGNMTYGGVQSCSRIRPSFCKVMSTEDHLVECDTFNANCVVIPAAVFLSLDNIDPFYVHGFGDYDYGLAATQKGYKIISSPFFIGMCRNNPVKGSWRDTSLSFKERRKAKEKINGSPSRVWFYFTKKHMGFLPACFTIGQQYMRMLLGKK